MKILIVVLLTVITVACGGQPNPAEATPPPTPTSCPPSSVEELQVSNWEQWDGTTVEYSNSVGSRFRLTVETHDPGKWTVVASVFDSKIELWQDQKLPLTEGTTLIVPLVTEELIEDNHLVWLVKGPILVVSYSGQLFLSNEFEEVEISLEIYDFRQQFPEFGEDA